MSDCLPIDVPPPKRLVSVSAEVSTINNTNKAVRNFMIDAPFNEWANRSAFGTHMKRYHTAGKVVNIGVPKTCDLHHGFEFLLRRVIADGLGQITVAGLIVRNEFFPILGSRLNGYQS